MEGGLLYLYLLSLLGWFVNVGVFRRSIEFILTALILLTAFRVKGGTDLSSYEGFWNAGLRGNSNEYFWFDIGQHALNNLLQKISQNFLIYKVFVVLVFCLAAKSIAQYFRISYVESLFIFFSIFFIPYFLNASGQGIVIGIFLLMVGRVMYPLVGLTLPFVHKSSLLFLLYHLAVFNKYVRIVAYVFPLFLVLYFKAHIELDFYSYDQSTYVDYAYKIAILAYAFLLRFISTRLKVESRFMLELMVVGFIYFCVLDYAGFGAAATRVFYMFKVFELMYFCKVVSLVSRHHNMLLVKFSLAIVLAPPVMVSIFDPNNTLGF